MITLEQLAEKAFPIIKKKEQKRLEEQKVILNKLLATFEHDMIKKAEKGETEASWQFEISLETLNLQENVTDNFFRDIKKGEEPKWLVDNYHDRFITNHMEGNLKYFFNHLKDNGLKPEIAYNVDKKSYYYEINGKYYINVFVSWYSFIRIKNLD